MFLSFAINHIFSDAGKLNALTDYPISLSLLCNILKGLSESWNVTKDYYLYYIPIISIEKTKGLWKTEKMAKDQKKQQQQQKPQKLDYRGKWLVYIFCVLEPQ